VLSTGYRFSKGSGDMEELGLSAETVSVGKGSKKVARKTGSGIGCDSARP
jgi:hypothetical protein